MDADWPFEDAPNVAVLTTRSIIDRTAPILLVSHDDEDGSWQFLPGGAPDVAEGRVVGPGTIMRIDSGVAELADLPEGWIAYRETPGAPWRREKHR